MICMLRGRDDTVATISHDLSEAQVSSSASFQTSFELSTSTASLASSENYAQDASEFNHHQNRSWKCLARIYERCQISYWAAAAAAAVPNCALIDAGLIIDLYPFNAIDRSKRRREKCKYKERMQEGEKEKS